MGLSGQIDTTGDVAMLKVTVYGNEHTVGLVDRVAKAEKLGDSVENQIKGAVTTLKVLGSACLGFITLLAACVEIYRAIWK